MLTLALQQFQRAEWTLWTLRTVLSFRSSTIASTMLFSKEPLSDLSIEVTQNYILLLMTQGFCTKNFTFAQSVFYVYLMSSDFMLLCVGFNFAEVVSLILVYELGKLLPGKVSLSEVWAGKGARW